MKDDQTQQQQQEPLIEGKPISVSPREQRRIQAATNRSQYKRTTDTLLNAHRRVVKRNRIKSTSMTLLTEDVVDSIIESIEKGHYPKLAVANTGISFAAFLKYLTKGKQDHDRLAKLAESGVPLREEDFSLHFELYMGLQKALFTQQDVPLEIIRQAGNLGDWKASAHFLERRFPKQWGRKLDQRIENTGTTNPNIQTVIMVPKRAESIEEWEELTKKRQSGKLEYENSNNDNDNNSISKNVFAGSSENEVIIEHEGNADSDNAFPADSAKSFEDVMNATE